jgi:pimeloyl-ACP methyl ester carboxylesterase
MSRNNHAEQVFAMRRRSFLAGTLALGVGGLFPVHAATQARAEGARVMPPQSSWEPVPPQVPVTEGMVDVGDARLWYWDTGGNGEAVIFLHPATGSAAIWGYQQPVLAQAGYRVVAYSRRGHYRSERGPEDRTGSAVEDLRALVRHLRIDRFHVVGFALGGFGVFDYALSYPDELASMTVACSLAGIVEPAFIATTQRLLPAGIEKLPASFRELSPSYRAANPEGTAAWSELEHIALVGPPLRQSPNNVLNWAAIERISGPVMLLTGDSDIYMPPVRLHEIASHLRNVERVVLNECGHSAYWEQPKAFNESLLRFLRRRR